MMCRGARLSGLPSDRCERRHAGSPAPKTPAPTVARRYLSDSDSNVGGETSPLCLGRSVLVSSHSTLDRDDSPVSRSGFSGLEEAIDRR